MFRWLMCNPQSLLLTIGISAGNVVGGGGFQGTLSHNAKLVPTECEMNRDQ